MQPSRIRNKMISTLVVEFLHKMTPDDDCMHQYCINPWSVLFGGLHMAAIYLENGFALSPKSYYNDIVKATSTPFAVITPASVSFALTIGARI